MQLDRRLFEGKVASSIVYPECFPFNKTDHIVNLGCGVGPQAVVYRGSYTRMVGVDLHQERLEQSKILLAERGVENYETVCAPVEATGLPDASFDKALAIDIIEHLPVPEKILQEAHRLLRPGGELLVSVPTMHDHYTRAFRAIGKFLGRKTNVLPQGHLDAHNSDLSLREWERRIARTPFRVVRSRATTLWPPLHLYGIPRFWFTHPLLHRIDRVLCHVPILKRFGQSLLFVLRKSEE